MPVLHSGLLNRRTTVPEVRLLSLPPFRLPPWTEADRRRAATSSDAGASPAGGSINHVAKVLLEARRLAKSEAWGQFPLATPVK
jgi:hypothetical protein